jgi:hypothetical protein
MSYIKERLLSQDKLVKGNMKDTSLLAVRHALNLHSSKLKLAIGQ